MSNTMTLNVPQVTVGLNTSTLTVPASGLYRVSVQSTDIPPSGLSIVVNKNGSPVYTSNSLAVTQIAQQFQTSFSCVATDVITVVLSSGSTIDAQLNSVKTNIAIMQGA